MSSTGISSEQLVQGERREVAVLFLDLSGFTALSEDLDHETVHRLTSGIMKALSRTIEACGGYIDKYEGDKVMALFGASRSYPDDCARAVLAGIRMLEIVDQIRDVLSQDGMTIGARAGISFGSVTVAPDPSGHLTATGDEVNVASRMESSAEVGTVQVSRRAMEKCRKRFTWVELGDRQLKGRRKPVQCYRPVETVLSCRERAPENLNLTGREQYLSLLGRTCKKAILKPEEGIRAVIFTGSGGAGKTAVVQTFARRMKSDSGIPVLFADATRFANRPFEMWVNALRYIHSQGDNLPAELPGKTDKMRYLQHLLGLRAMEEAALLSPADLRKEFSSVLTEFLLLLAGKGYLFILDDLQWIDSASAEVLGNLLSACPQDKPLMIAGCLSTDESNDDTAPPDWAENSSRVLFRHLDPLTEENIQSLSEEILCESIPGMNPSACSSIARGVHQHSQGNPFIAVELLRHLLESRILTGTGTGKMWGDVIPESVKDLIRTRIDSIPGGERRVLQMASLLGDRFEENLFLRVSSKFRPGDETATGDLLSRLKERGILTRTIIEDRVYFKFAKAFYREVAGLTVLRQNRVSISRTAALELTELSGGGPSLSSWEIATYWKAAGCVDKALDAGLKALEHYSITYQNLECLHTSELMKNWISSDSERFGDALMMILIMEQKVLYRTGRYSEMETVLEQQIVLAERRGDSSELGKTYCSIGELNRIRGKSEKSSEFLRKAVEYSRAAGDFPTLGMSLNNLGALNSSLGRLDDAVEFFREAVSIQKEAGNLRSAGAAISNLASMFLQSGDISLARSSFQEAADLFRETGYKLGEAHVLCNLGLLVKGEGLLEEALELQKRSFELNRQTGHSLGMARTLAELGRIQIMMSAVEEGENNLSEALELAVEMNNSTLELSILVDMSLSACNRNEPDAACKLYSRAAGSCGETTALYLQERVEQLRIDLIESGIPEERLSAPSG